MERGVEQRRIQQPKTDERAHAPLIFPAVASDGDDFAADPSTTGVFALDGTATGYLHASNDVDWFAITVEAGETVEISTDGQTLVRFYNAAGVAVTPAFHDVIDYSTSGVGIAYFGFTATTTATYYVAATGGSLRNYTLTATVSSTAHPLDLANAPSLTNGVAVTGSFEDLRDDWFQVDLAAGESVVLPIGTAQGMRIYDANGNSLTTAQGGRLLFTATLAGTYYVNAYGAPGQGFSLTPHIYVDDYADINPFGAETRGTIDAVNGFASGTIEMGGDSDLIELTLAEQQTVRIVLTPTSGTLLNGVTVELVDANGTSHYGQVAGGVGVPSVLLFSAPVSGTYTIVVEGRSQTDTGAYTLQVTPVADDYSHDSSNPGSIVNETFSGNLETALDVDRFSFNGVAGQVIRIEVEHYTNSINGFTLPPVLHGPNGEVIAPSFVAQLGGDVILYRLPEDGAYAFDVRGETRTAAPYHYQYNVTTIPDFAIPDAFYFLVPENFALWTNAIDPGPTPTGPSQSEVPVGRLDGVGLPILESLNFTLEEGETLFISNNGTVAVNTQIDQFPALGMGGNTLTNHGTIWIQNNNLYPTMAVAYTFTDFVNTGTIFSQAWNSATGTNLAAAVFTNLGDIIAFSTTSYAVGAQFEYTPGGAINAGRIYAIAQSYFAAGVQIGAAGGEFYNYGEIFAAGMGGATGISFSWGGTVVNEGSIIAEYGGDLFDLNASGFESHGIHNGQVFPLYVFNSGLIQADIAISTYGTVLNVVNATTGVIRGDIVARGDEGAGANDTIYNDGLIDGDVILAEGQDLYDGLGVITGALYLGDGDDAAVGGDGADRFYGDAGNDVLDGWLGDDTLDGGLGDDSLSGGDGNDTIFYDAADNAANVQGGAGLDKLVFTSGGPPVSFSLTGHGFEIAEGRFAVSGATFSDFYDSQWRLSYEEGEASNGASWFIDWDETSSAPYQRLNQDFDAIGQLAHEYGLSDNGSTWDQFFDTDGTHSYTSILQVHTAAGVYATEHGINDNGSTWDTFYDVDGSNPFQWIQQVRDVNGVLAQEEGLADGGTRWFTDFDETGTTDYVFYQNVYDTLNRLSFQNGQYDTGYTWTIDYDETNTQPWTSIRNDYDDHGVLIGTTTILDGP